MNHAQTVVLTQIIGNIKRLEFTLSEVKSWHLILADTDFEDAKGVTIAYLRDHPGEWMEAGHICRGVEDLRRLRTQRYGSLVPEHYWPELAAEDDGGILLCKTRELAELVASGKVVRGPLGRPELCP